MTKFYQLDHYHSFKGHSLSVNIGTFSSYALAESYIDKLIDKAGFKLYPRANFVITEVTVGAISWANGFEQTENGDIEIKNQY